MNVQALKRMSVIPTHCAAIQKGHTSVVASMDTRVMVEAAQVNICFMRLFAIREKVVDSKVNVNFYLVN